MQPGVRECGCCMPWVGFWSGQGLSPCRCDEASDNEGGDSVRTGVECHMVWVQQGMGNVSKAFGECKTNLEQFFHRCGCGDFWLPGACFGAGGLWALCVIRGVMSGSGQGAGIQRSHSRRPGRQGLNGHASPCAAQNTRTTRRRHGSRPLLPLVATPTRSSFLPPALPGSRNPEEPPPPPPRPARPERPRQPVRRAEHPHHPPATWIPSPPAPGRHSDPVVIPAPGPAREQESRGATTAAAPAGKA